MLDEARGQLQSPATKRSLQKNRAVCYREGTICIHQEFDSVDAKNQTRQEQARLRFEHL